MPAPKKSKSTTPFRCRAFFNKAPGLEPDRVRASSKREAFVASRRRCRKAPEAGARPHRGRADVPLPAPVKSTSTAASRCRAFYYQVPGLEPDRVRASSKREAFVASRRRRRKAPEAGARPRRGRADVPLPAPWSKEDFGKDRFNRLCPRVSTNPEVPSAAAAYLRSKYADVPLPAPSTKEDVGTDNSAEFPQRLRDSR